MKEKWMHEEVSVNLVYEIISALQFSPCLIPSHHNRFLSYIYIYILFIYIFYIYIMCSVCVCVCVCVHCCFMMVTEKTWRYILLYFQYLYALANIRFLHCQICKFRDVYLHSYNCLHLCFFGYCHHQLM